MYMQTSLVLRLISLTGLIGVAGCSTLYGEQGVLRGKSDDYLKTGTLKPIELPEGMSSKPLEPLYVIPEVTPRDEFGDIIVLDDFEVPRPLAINTEQGSVGVKLQKLGDRKWIFLNASTSQVWPRTQNFLSEYGIRVVDSDPARGLIETSDVIFKNDTETKSRFRISIEKGVHPETTEVHILQMQFPASETTPAAITWPKVSMNVERERQLLDELATVLAQNVNNNSASLLGQNVGGDAKVEFLRNQSEPTMRLRLQRERAKATLVHALEKEGFVIWDQASDKGLYYVGFDGKDRGFFTRWFGGSLPDKAPYEIEKLLQHLEQRREVEEKFSGLDGVAFGSALPNNVGFLVVVGGDDLAMDLVIRDTRGRYVPRAKAKELLRIIRKNLI